MQAIVIEEPGDENVLQIGTAPDPVLGPGQVRIAVKASALNRADLLQRQGMYPPPPGASPILGLECSGVIAELGEGVQQWQVGDRVMALLAGGGYAEQVVVDAGSCMKVPENLDLVEAGGLAEVCLTVFLNVFQLGALETGAGCWCTAVAAGSEPRRSKWQGKLAPG